MSALAPARQPAVLGARAASPALPLDGRARTGVRLFTFTALALFCVGHWAGLLADPPLGRVVLMVALAAPAAALLAATRRITAAPARPLVRIAIALAGFSATLLAAGLPLRLLAPWHWDDLAVGLDHGLGGAIDASWPYAGGEPWVALTILLAAPVALSAAAALAFWPLSARRAATARFAALAALLGLYGVAATEHQFPSELMRGLVLFVLLAAWLWIERIPRASALGAGVLVVLAALVALPIAARADDARAWVDYQSFGIFQGTGASSFDWSHSYGPIDWPRTGATVLRVRSADRHYWRSQVLDRFDGRRWVHSPSAARNAFRAQLPPLDAGKDMSRWVHPIGVEVESMRSELLVGAGFAYNPQGLDGRGIPTEQATEIRVDPALERGDEYGVTSYDPKPTRREMIAARDIPAAGTEARDMVPFTEVELPAEVPEDGPGLFDNPGTAVGGSPAEVVTVGLRELRDREQVRRVDAQLEPSRYGRVYELARELGGSASDSRYTVVRRIESHLRENYMYAERPGVHDLPLDAFLFEDRIGYCQHFAGAMALLLRMNGIPARIASGFSPGRYDEEGRFWQVRDLDAHSWVEVYFPGVGWVSFDPTPASAPAQGRPGDMATSTSPAGDLPALRGDDGTPGSSGGLGRSVPDASGATAVAQGGSGVDLELVLGALGGALVLAVAALLVRAGRRRRRARDDPDRAALAELEAALGRLGHPVPAGTTLLTLERSLARTVGPAAAGYVGRLRRRRFAAAGDDGPTRGDRRALRRELGSGGLLRRLRAMLAMPPAPFSGVPGIAPRGRGRAGPA